MDLKSPFLYLRLGLVHFPFEQKVVFLCQINRDSSVEHNYYSSWAACKEVIKTTLVQLQLQLPAGTEQYLYLQPQVIP